MVFSEQALPRVVERYHEEDGFDPSAVVFSQLRLEAYSIVLHELLGLWSGFMVGVPQSQYRFTHLFEPVSPQLIFFKNPQKYFLY